MYTGQEVPDVDAVFAALAHPTRRAILERLIGGEAMVTELAEPFDMTQPAISHHVRVLEEAGLILRRAEGTKRPCRLSPDGVATVDRWLELLRQALSANYARLDALLAGTPTKKEEPTP
jgi:DNA-binding transcriptional ArsR family regulator